MSLYIVHRRNPYFKTGTVLDLFEDGFQECILNAAGKVFGNRGLLHNEEQMMPFCMKMLSKGFDDPKLRRKSGRNSTEEAMDRPDYPY